ncbi:hypothetical protein ACA910_003995 [Epithemia clementina (nom. ined.)]
MIIEGAQVKLLCNTLTEKSVQCTGILIFYCCLKDKQPPTRITWSNSQISWKCWTTAAVGWIVMMDLSKILAKTAVDPNNPAAAEQTAATKEAHDWYLALAFLAGADQTK